MTKNTDMDKSQHLKIYNTLTRRLDELTQADVGLYVCGPTVYDVPHIGHARSAYVFDVIRRYMSYSGKKVTFVRNVTDIDDKIISKAFQELEGQAGGEAGLSDKVKEVAVRYLKDYHEALDILGILPPDLEPKATETIGEMIEFINLLINKGFAYASGGSVYFEVRKFKDYGRLSSTPLTISQPDNQCNTNPP